MAAWGKPDGNIENDPCEVDIYESLERIETIRLDGLALLQIVKHCHDNTPRCVTGSLLGLENGKVLEITHTFASPDPEKDDSNGDQFQIDMMKNLRDVNVDNNKVGWYQSTSFGSFISSAVMEYQFQYQEILGPNAVALIYDPTQTTKGSLYLKAFRLTKEFFEHYRKNAAQRDGFAKLDVRSDNIIEEIPITLYNTELVSCWLYENGRKVSAECDFDRLDMSTNSYLVNHLIRYVDV